MTVGPRPFSRPIRVETIPREGLRTIIEADAAERAALAAFNNLHAVGRLVADLTLKPGVGGVINVRGEVAADITQTCVVTLEPFAASFVEPVDLQFAAPSAAPARRSATEGERESAALDDGDQPDPIIEGKIDLGALAAEFLTLGLDPYPRKPGAAFEPPKAGQSPADSPFSGLADPKKGA
jgi:hypothetical protein